MTAPLSLPPRPPAARPARVSWAAFLAPVVMAAVLWLVTRSPYALAFAALGPVGALISFWEARHGNGREGRAARAERAAELARLRELVAAAQDEERREALRRAPGAEGALAAVGGPELWRAGGEAVVRLGLGVVRSAVRLSGDAREGDEEELQRAAARLEDAPVLAAAASGVAVCGQTLLARAVLRGLLVQLYAAHPPGALAPPLLHDPAGAATGEWDWLERLPHGIGAGGPAPRVGVFAETRDVPPGYAAVLTVTSPGAAVAELYGQPSELPAPREPRLVPELVSRALAEEFVAALAARAAGLGLGTGARTLPAAVAFGDLPPAGGPGLGASLGRSLGGVCAVDLVADGPHAVVAGVTGSGKSELLVTWVAGMVAGRSTDEVVVLLVDFKGGTAFRPLAAVPHTVGVITDLGRGEAARALSSLAAELRRREAELARLGVRDVAEAGAALPRLVIVVDEFAAMLDAFPEFGALFTDIAARGRALGVHLILATQRPAGVMRDALVANCPLRLSLRVQSPEDSRWVVGTDAASRIPATAPGRCVIARDGATTEVQLARTSAEDIAAVAAATPPRPAPRRPWLDPLPATVTRAQLPASADAAVAAVADLPDRQRRELMAFRPGDGPLAVVGAARSGKTTLLRLVSSLAAAAGMTAVHVGADREQAWDAVIAAAERCDTPEPGAAPVLLAVDDADAVVARLGEEYGAVWCERLSRVLRDGPACGVHAVLAAQRPVGALRGVLALARETVLLRQPSREEHVLAGAPVELYDPALPPGGGVWRGRRVQFLLPDPADGGGGGAEGAGDPPVTVPLVPARGDVTVLICRAPARVLSRARAAGLPADAIVDLGAVPVPGVLTPESALAVAGRGTGLLLVGDPEAWLARWSLLAGLRARHPLVFLGCDAADVRAVTHSRTLPPPLAPGAGTGWLVTADGRARRCRLE